MAASATGMALQTAQGPVATAGSSRAVPLLYGQLAVQAGAVDTAVQTLTWLALLARWTRLYAASWQQPASAGAARPRQTQLPRYFKQDIDIRQLQRTKRHIW